MKAVKTVMSDHFLLMNPNKDAQQLMLEKAMNDMTQGVMMLQNFEEESREFRDHYVDFVKALKAKMAEVITSFNNSQPDLKQKLEELIEIINKG